MRKYFLPISRTGPAVEHTLLRANPHGGDGPGHDLPRQRRLESCCDCCPHCGCRLVPVCHVYWTTKEVTTYKYTCKCDYICVPGVTRLCDKCGDDDGCRDCKCRLPRGSAPGENTMRQASDRSRNAPWNGSARSATTTAAAWKTRRRRHPCRRPQRPCRRRPGRSNPPGCCRRLGRFTTAPSPVARFREVEVL